MQPDTTYEVIADNTNQPNNVLNYLLKNNYKRFKSTCRRNNIHYSFMKSSIISVTQMTIPSKFVV